MPRPLSDLRRPCRPKEVAAQPWTELAAVSYSTGVGWTAATWPNFKWWLRWKRHCPSDSLRSCAIKGPLVEFPSTASMYPTETPHAAAIDAIDIWPPPPDKLLCYQCPRQPVATVYGKVQKEAPCPQQAPKTATVAKRTGVAATIRLYWVPQGLAFLNLRSHDTCLTGSLFA